MTSMQAAGSRQLHVKTQPLHMNSIEQKKASEKSHIVLSAYRALQEKTFKQRPRNHVYINRVLLITLIFYLVMHEKPARSIKKTGKLAYTIMVTHPGKETFILR